MAVKFRGQTTAATGATTIPIPTGTAVGDLLILVDYYRPTYAAAPTGWTQVPGSFAASGLNATGAQQEAYYKFAAAADITAGQITYTVGDSSATIVAFSGVDSSSPFAGFANTGAASSTSVVAPSVTPTAANPMLVCFFYGGGTVTAPAAMTALAQSTNGVAAYQQLTQASGVATGTRTATSSVANVNQASTFALAPASAAQTATPTPRTGARTEFGFGPTSIAVPVPAGAAVGDLLVVEVAVDRAVTVTPPSGFTAAVTQTGSGTTQGNGVGKNYTQAAVYSGVLTQAQVTAGSVTFQTSAACFAVAVTALIGDPNTTSPVAAVGSSQSVVAPSVTGAPNTLLLALFAYKSNPTGTPTAPTGMTVVGTQSDTSNATDYHDANAWSQVISSSAATGTKTLTPGATVQNGSPVAFTVLLASANSAPNAPTLNQPANASYQDVSAGLTVSWTFSDPNATDTQTAYALRRKISGAGAYEYWNAGTNAWQSTEIYNSSAAQSVVFGAGFWTNGNIYNWSVSTRDSAPAPLAGPYATDATFTAQAVPQVSVTAPTGTQGTQQPTVVWATTVPSGAVQTAYRLVVESGAYGSTPGSGTTAYNSGVQAGAANQALIGSLLTQGTYRAFVQVTETGGQVSTWGFTTFTVAYAGPATPVTTATVEPTLGRVRVDVQARDNLLSTNQASLETDTTGWNANANVGLARSTAQALDGVASLSLTATAAGDMSVRTDLGTGASVPQVVPGQTYTAVASFRAAATARTCSARLAFLDAAGAFMAANDTTGVGVADTTTGFTQATVSAVAPAGATRVVVILNVLAAAAGEVHYADNISVAAASSTTWTRGGLSGLNTALVERSVDGGATWQTVRGAATVALPTPSEAATVYDYEAPARAAALYRTTVQAIVGGATLASTPSASSAVATNNPTWFLKDPQVPALNAVLYVESEDRQKPEQQGQFPVLGRSRKIVVRGSVMGEELDLTVLTFSAAEYAALNALREGQRVLLLQSDQGESWYVAWGPMRPSSWATRGTVRVRRTSIQFTEVDAP